MQPTPTRLLDVPISVFTNAYATEPMEQTTLRRIAKTAYYRPLIEAIRSEADATKQATLKSQLPAITPVVLLHHRRANASTAQKINQQWPMLMGDIDQKDNPGVDMAQLKEALSTLPWVLLCAYSVRGGLWFVMRLPDEQTPETLAAHFRHLQRLFQREYGIKLDSSKGGNPTDLRFVAYDPAPYLNDEAKMLNRTYTPRPTPRATFKTGRSSTRPHAWPDDCDRLTQLVRRVEVAGAGNRHTTLLKEAKLAGGYIAAGRMDEQTTVCALETVASEWPNFGKSQKTIRDGIRFGMAEPIYADEYTTRLIAISKLYGKTPHVAPAPPPVEPTPPPRSIVEVLTKWNNSPGTAQLEYL